jgi:hypothetical protein
MLASNSVDTMEIVDGSVGTAELADWAVNRAKLSATGGSDGQVLKLSGGALTWAPDDAGGLTLPWSGQTSSPTSGAAFEAINVGGGMYGVSGGGAIGVYGSGSAAGVFGTGSTDGVRGSSPVANGVLGTAGTSPPAQTLGVPVGVHGLAGSGGVGVAGITQDHIGVHGYNVASNNYGNVGTSQAGVFGNGTGVSSGVYGASVNGYGVLGESSNGVGVYGEYTASGNRGSLGAAAAGAYGFGNDGWGVWGVSNNDDAVRGESGGAGKSGVYGVNTLASGYGVFGRNSAGGVAGGFDGNVQVWGNLNVTGTKNFAIEHPLEPGRLLVHAAVESSEVLNTYSGNVFLDEDGEADVELPAWFDAVNTDFRYQLTAVGAASPGLHIAKEIAGNRFRIAGGPPGLKVSWEVTGVRNDPFMREHPFVAERDALEERGTHLAP